MEDPTSQLSHPDYDKHFDPAVYLRNEFGGDISQIDNPEIDLFLKLHKHLHDTFKDGTSFTTRGGGREHG